MLLIAGGSKAIEVIDLQNPDVTCEPLPDLPYELYFATGQLYEGETPIVCGGIIKKDGDKFDSCDCFVMVHNQWITTVPLKSCGGFISSALITDRSNNELMLVTGGVHQYSKTVYDTVNSFDGSAWSTEAVTSMPNRVYRHCLMK